MKRKISEYQCSSDMKDNTRSKKPYLIVPKEYDEYVSGSSVINWFTGDCLVDWLKFKNEISKERFHEENYLCEQGNRFEKAVVEWIDKNVVQTVKVADPKDWSPLNVYRTFEQMQKGTPIIYSASIRNKHLKLNGTADLLVRNDYIHKLFQDLEIEEEKSNTVFSHSYFYYVIDVKWCTLHLLADGKGLQNIDRIPGYKGQLSIYNQCLAEMQGYKPTYSFLLGRRAKWSAKGVEYVTTSPFTRPGIFKTDDNEFNKKVEKAIDWVRDLRFRGHLMSVNPPSRLELYPNLGNKYYFDKKRELAQQIGDISQIFKVKSKKKELTFNKGIMNIFDYRLSGENLGFKGDERELIDKIIWVNRQSELKIDLSQFDKRYLNEVNEIFVDFEKFTDIFDNFQDIVNHKSFDMIFLIGVYHRSKGGVWEYTPFLINSICREEEMRIIREFYNFYLQKHNPRVWYWFAEDKFWKGCLERHPEIEDIEIRWEDLRKVLIENKIVIKGCYDYKLKSVLKGLKESGLIDTVNDSECQDGVDAMLKTWKYFSEGGERKVIDQVLRYNHFDVKGMKDVIDVLRK